VQFVGDLEKEIATVELILEKAVAAWRWSAR